MSERSIVAKLRAEVGDYVAGMNKAAKATEKVGESSTKTEKATGSAFARMGQSFRKNEQHYNRMGNAALIGGAAIATGVGFGVKAFADFDSAMSGANAALAGSGANMDKLRKLAIDLGKDTQFSSAEAAQGITELAKAGVSAADIMGGGLAGALSLAAAGELEVADASEIAASAMTQFGLKGRDIPHIADLLAAGAGKAQGSVRDMGMALNQAGLVAAQTGLTIEETTGALASFASAGLVGSDAGTSLKTMLQRLTPQSEEAAKQFEALGVSAYDSQGNFVGLTDFAGQLQEKLSKLTPEARNSALGVMFGSDAVRAASVIYDQGADGVQAWIDKVNDAGFAAEQAALKTDNLRGDFERLTGAIDGVVVSNGSGVNDFLRSLTQGAEGAVEAFGRMPETMQKTVLGLGTATGAALLLAGAGIKATSAVLDMKDSLDAAGISGGKFARTMGVVGAAVAAAAVSTAAFDKAGSKIADWMGASATGVETATDRILKGKDATADFATSLETATSAGAGFGSIFEKVSPVANLFGGGIDSARDSLSNYDQALAALVASGNGERAAQFLEAAGVSAERAAQALPQYSAATQEAANQQELAGGSGEKFAGELQGIAESSQTAEEKLSGLVDEIKGFGSAALGAQGAESAFQAAIDDATASVEKNGRTLNLNSEAGRANDSALRGLASAALESSSATLELTGSADAAAAKITTGRAAFVASATQMGLTKAQADKLADSYGLIPENVATSVKAPGAIDAKRQADNFTAAIRAIPQSKVSKIAAQVSGIGTVQYLKALVDSMNSKTVNIRYTVSGSLPNGSRSLRGGSTADADGGIHEKHAGSLVRAFADGGFAFDTSLGGLQPQMLRSRASRGGLLVAEEGAGPWEAFISGNPTKAPRSRMVAEDVVGRLGGQIQWLKAYADGGIRDRSSTATLSRPVASVQTVSAVASISSRDMDALASKVAGAMLAVQRGTALDQVTSRKAGR